MLDSLLEHARHHWHLDDPIGDETRRDHLEAAERATGKRPAGLDGPPLPVCVVHIWTWWHDLARVRRSNGWGPEPIGHADILAWAILTQSAPRPAEVAAILALDQAYLAHLAGRQTKE